MCMCVCVCVYVCVCVCVFVCAVSSTLCMCVSAEFLEYIYFCMCVSTEYIYLPNPSAQAGCDTRSIFKQSLISLNTVFLLLDWLPYQG